MLKISAGPSDLERLQTPGLAILLDASPAEAPRIAIADGAVQRVLSRRDFRASRDETIESSPIASTPLSRIKAQMMKTSIQGMGSN